MHKEQLTTLDDFLMLMMREGLLLSNNKEGELLWESKYVGHVQNTCWPNEMTSFDFLGPGGIMCVGKVYTICDTKSWEAENDVVLGGNLVKCLWNWGCRKVE